MPKLTVLEVDGRIAELRAVLDRTSANLVELDGDVTRQLLERSTALRGATAEAWRDAAARHANLWKTQLAVEGAFSRIDEERGTRKVPSQAVLERVGALLTGPCVEMPAASESDRPSLTGARGPVTRVPIEDALEHMSDDYDVVTALVTTTAKVWGDCMDRLDRVDEALAELRTQLQDRGARQPNQLRVLEDAVREARVLAREDPVSFAQESIDALEAGVGRVRATLDDAARVHEARAQKLSDAERAVQSCLTAERACREALERTAQKIVLEDATWTSFEKLAGETEQLRTEHQQCVALGNEAAAGRISRRADEVLGEFRGLAATTEDRLERREELRGLLGAYRAKADAVGLAEDFEVDKAYVTAQGQLYTAPCDLAASERLVEEFSRAIRDRSGVTQ